MTLDPPALEPELRKRLEGVPQAGLLVDSAGRIALANAQACRLLAYAPEELQGASVERLVPPPLREAHAAERRRYQIDPRQRAVGTGMDLRVVRKDGIELAVEIGLTPVGAPENPYVLVSMTTLEPQEYWYRSMFEQLAVAVVHTDADGRHLNVNRKFCELSGYTHEEALKLDIRRVTHAEDLADSLAARARMLSGQQTDYEREVRLICKGGAIVWTRVTTSLVRSHRSTAGHFISLIQDISRQKIAEEATREMDLRFRQVTENIREVFWLSDPLTGEWLYVSPGYREIWGRDPKELRVVPDAWFEAVHPDDRERVREAARTKQLSGRYDEEYRIVRPDGQLRWIRDRAFPVRTDGVDETRVAGIAEDVTARRRDEEMRARLAAIVENTDDAIVGKNLEGTITSWNAGAERLFGYAAEEALGLPISLIIPQDRLDEEAEIVRRLRLGQRISRLETVRLRKDGSSVDVSLTISPILDANGCLVGASKIARDIGERKRAEVKIRQLNRVYAILSEINALIIRVREKDELFHEACKIAVDLGGFCIAWLAVVDTATRRLEVVAWHGVEEAFIRRLPLSLKEDDTLEYGLGGRAVNEGRPIIGNDTARSPPTAHTEPLDELQVRTTVYVPLLLGTEVVGVLALYANEVDFFDEEEMKLLQELAGDIAFALDHIDKAHRVDYLAYYDALTGLANRTLFLERLNQRIHSVRVAEEALAVVLVDVERLRTVNESLGRAAGDTLLKRFGARLRRVTDGMKLGRYGGDVFAIVLEGIGSRSRVERVLAALWRECFAEPFMVARSELRISAKAGVALFPADGADADSLLSSAESALRRAKQTGERFVFQAPELTARRAENFSMETKLRRALERDELALHYQPKIDLQTRRIVGVEALLRWHSPDFGIVPPRKFIPIMEETGMILEAGGWALSRAVADHRRWVELGVADQRVAVNVSSIQLRRKDFVATVAAALKAGVEPSGIDLEITESLLVEDIEDNIRKLRELHGLGLSIAIDDFGTGYSSLAYLAKLPVQAVKIDRSFIVEMLEDPDTMTLVHTIISLAHSLKLKVIAEGVDAEEQAKLLRLLRCDEMQGYLFSRPFPFEQMTAQLEKQRDAQTARR